MVLVNGFRHGFSLNSRFDSVSHSIPPNHKSATDHSTFVDKKIEKELLKGRIRGPFKQPPFENFVCSPLGVVPKKEPGQFRLIHDLSYPRGNSINSCISTEFSFVEYQNIEYVIDLVQSAGRFCLMAKTDVEDAFRLIPIKSSEHHLLGFHWKGAFYNDCVLAMGASSSCQIFETFSTSLQWIMSTKFGISGLSHLLDDFVFIGKADSQECFSALQTFLCLANTLGVPIKKEKTVMPCTRLTIYGIELDSVEMVARLPQDKVVKISNMLILYKQKRRIKLRELQSLLGLLNFACGVIIPGRAFLRRLFDLTIGHTCPYYWITLTSEARLDLKLWYDFIKNYNGKSCFLFQKWLTSDSIKLFSDSAGTYGGYAAVCGNKWIAGPWFESIKDQHITVKELFPIVLAVELWGPLLSNHKILFMTDNSAVSDIINSTTSSNKVVMILVRRLVLAALKHNIFFRSKHISGKTNLVCDLLSRFSFQEALQVAPWLEKTPVKVPDQLLTLSPEIL